MSHKLMRYFRFANLIRLAAAIAVLLCPLCARAQKTCESLSASSIKIGSFESSPIFAPNRAAVSAFDVAAKLQAKQLERLIQYRGVMSQYVDPDTSNMEKLNEVLQDNYTSLVSSDWRGAWGRDYALGILFYSYSDDVLRSWLVSRCGIEAYIERPISAESISKMIAAVRSALNIRARQAERAPQPRRRGAVLEDQDESAPPSLAKASDDLTALLFPPNFQAPLKRFSYLLIVPALDIGTVPFSMLKPFGNDDYLTDHLSFSIAASLADAQSLVHQAARSVDVVYAAGTGRPHRALLFQKSVVVGNPMFASDPDYILPPLQGAEKEARAVATLVDGKLLVGAEATKDAITAATTHATFLYVATHGVADPDNPLNGSFLALSGPDPRWTARQIQNSQFKNALVVLSACQTGLGKTHEAGIIGLARAFQLAGADVVMSLWSIDDDATVDLMTAFVNNLKTEGQADALRDAMQSTRKIHPDPSRWASFAVFGNLW